MDESYGPKLPQFHQIPMIMMMTQINLLVLMIFFNLYHHDSNSPEILEDMKSQFHVVNHVMNLLIGISRTIKTYSLLNHEEPKINSESSYFDNRSKVCYFLHLRIRYWIDKYCLSIIHSDIIMLKQLA